MSDSQKLWKPQMRLGDVSPCKIYIVRHAQTEANVARQLTGQTDSPLTKEGIQQAKLMAGRLKKVHFDAIYSSDLIRAQKTAQVIASEHEMLVRTSALLRERSYGVYEGKRYDEYDEVFDSTVKAYEQASADKRHRFKFLGGIENDEKLVGRIIQFLREAALAHLGKKVLVVSHGSVIRQLLIHFGYALFEELSYDAVDNTAYVVILSDGVEFYVDEVVGVKKARWM